MVELRTDRVGVARVVNCRYPLSFVLNCTRKKRARISMAYQHCMVFVGGDATPFAPSFVAVCYFNRCDSTCSTLLPSSPFASFTRCRCSLRSPQPTTHNPQPITHTLQHSPQPTTQNPQPISHLTVHTPTLQRNRTPATALRHVTARHGS
jgi:hypothetical protein